MTRPVLRRQTTGTISGRLGAVLLNRRSVVMGQKVAKQKVLADGEPIAIIPADANPLSDILQQARYEPRPARTGEYLHVSDLISRCVRKFAIVEQSQMMRPGQRLSLTDSLTFAQGDAIHDVIKARAAVGSPGQVWGNWRCSCGNMRTAEPSTLADAGADLKCSACHGGYTEYHEVPMRNEEHKIVGTPDLLLFLRDFQAFYITELKSIAHDRWVDLVRPIPDHVIQIVFYWWLMRELGHRITNRVSVLYVTKGWMFKGDPYKEFHFDASAEVRRLEPYLREAKALIEFRSSGKLPARTMCAAETAPEAKKCEVCSACFGGDGNAPKTISISTALRRR